MLIEMLLSIVIIFIIAVLLVWFKPLWVMNYCVATYHCQIIKDLPYADDLRHTQDLYIPKKSARDKPIVVFVHGGAWDDGHKNDYKFVGLAFSEMGYITAIPNYRLYPQVLFPHFIEDVARAIAHLPQRLTDQGIESNTPLKVILVGHSAGAHSAAMLVTKSEYLTVAGAQVEIKGFIGLAGPYDLPLDDDLVVGKFDGVTLHEKSESHVDTGHVHNDHDANPINLAMHGMPPTLLIHGAKDDTVGPYHSERFSLRLTRLKVPHETLLYKNADHRHLIGALSIFARFLNPVYKDIERFLKSL
jgi:acetyl esterase/lipase